MQRKVDCIKRYIELAGQEELKQFLLVEKIAKPSDFADISNKEEIAQTYYLLLREAEREEKIILLYYEWSLLPKEKITITISTERNHKEFSHGF